MMGSDSKRDARDPALLERARAAYRRSVGNPDPRTEPDPIMLARLERALASLPKLTREVFLAHRIDDLSYGEIAKVTGLTPQAVERHMVKAIGRLARYAGGNERPAWRHWLASVWAHWLR